MNTAALAYGQKMGRSLSNSIYFILAILISLSTTQTNTGTKLAPPQLLYVLECLCNGSRVHKPQKIGGPAYRITNSYFTNTKFLLCAVPCSTVRVRYSYCTRVQPQSQCNPLTDSTPEILVNPRTFYFRSGRRKSPHIT